MARPPTPVPPARAPAPRVDSGAPLDLSALMDEGLAEAMEAAAAAEPEPLMLDASALSVLEDGADVLEPSTLPGDDAAPDPSPFDAPEALSGSALRALDPELQMPPREDEIPLMEGFEGTRLDEGTSRPTRRSSEGPRQPKTASDFSYQACPSCQAPQPQPSPSYCEACGTRLKKPGAKKEAAGAVRGKRCSECGYRNREDAFSCTNCGQHLKS
jgi:double zinc ribbon protein